MSQSLSHPFMSVLIRSYNRLPHVLEILEVCMTQDYDNFEVVVLEQSTPAHWEEHQATFEKYDQRVRVIRSQPLGPPGARNAGVIHCKGDVVLFMDDDDLPIGDSWIAAHAKNYADPHCLGVSGGHLSQLGRSHRYKDMQKAYKRCLTLSFFLKGRTYTDINQVKQPVQWLHGNNSSIRRSLILKLGGWNPHIVSDHEEHSLFYKLRKNLQPDEYLKFDPEPKVLRRWNIVSGVGRRTMSLTRLLDHRLQYYHWVVSKYHPLRFYGLYPFFMLFTFHSAMNIFIRNFSFKDTFWIRVFGQRRGQYLYILQELVKFPFMVLRFLLTRNPTWDDQIVLPEDA